MTTYHHVSLWKPMDAAGVHLGGVEVFAHYLQRAIPELELISFPDFPEWRSYWSALEEGKLRDYDLAVELNGWLWDSGALSGESIVVTDGYWGLGLAGKVRRLISVVHGSYYGRFVQSQISPWGEIVGMDHVEAQFEMWDDPHTEVVCVAQESVEELKRASVGQHNIRVIYHGVDLDVYKPGLAEPRYFMHAATNMRKGGDILEGIFAMAPDLRVEFMAVHSGIDEDKARRLNEAVALIAPTRHEGSAYALIEALACGVPLITYQTGLAIEMDERCGIILDDIAPHNFVRHMRGFDRKKYKARQWAQENADFETFAQEWRKYLNVE